MKERENYLERLSDIIVTTEKDSERISAARVLIKEDRDRAVEILETIAYSDSSSRMVALKLLLSLPKKKVIDMSDPGKEASNVQELAGRLK